MKYLVAALAAFAVAGSAHAGTNDFDQASDTAGATVDRYAPATFQSGVAFGGHAGTLVEGVSAADGQNSRPSPYNAPFYNTQGYQFATEAGTTTVSVELYYSADWTKATDARYAGLWGVGYDQAQLPDSPVVAYPILEGYRVGGVDSFRGYNAETGAWFDMGPATYGWNTLSIQLLTGTDQYRYTVNGLSETFSPANGSKSISATILQVYNTTDGVSYDAHWDNLTNGAVPEPATWAMMIVGFGLAGATLRRRRAVAA